MGVTAWSSELNIRSHTGKTTKSYQAQLTLPAARGMPSYSTITITMLALFGKRYIIGALLDLTTATRS